MIILDTNVISEPFKLRPDPAVQAWMDKQDPVTLFTTVTTLTELKMGVAIMPFGEKRFALEHRIQEALRNVFPGRILDVTPRVAEQHAAAFAIARQLGVTINFADAQIAAIARVHGFAVATRDVAPFEAAGVEVINPWESVE